MFIKGRRKQLRVRRGDGSRTCGDGVSPRKMQGHRDGAARPGEQVEGLWMVHTCTHRCGLRGQLLNQSFL